MISFRGKGPNRGQSGAKSLLLRPTLGDVRLRCKSFRVLFGHDGLNHRGHNYVSLFYIV